VPGQRKRREWWQWEPSAYSNPGVIDCVVGGSVGTLGESGALGDVMLATGVATWGGIGRRRNARAAVAGVVKWTNVTWRRAVRIDETQVYSFRIVHNILGTLHFTI